MKSELEGATHPDEGSIERALPGVNRRFDEMGVTMKLGFHKLNERLLEKECHRENSSEDGRAAQRRRLDLAVQLTEVAMKICQDGGGGRDNGVATVTDGGGSESEDGGGVSVSVGHDVRSRTPQSVRQMYNEYFGLCDFVNVPVEGGLFGLEKGGKEWRKHFSAADSRFFSRMQQVVEAVDREAKAKTKEVTDVLDEFDTWFVEKRRAFSPFVKLLQAKKLVPQGKNRMSCRDSSPTGEGGGGFS
jgi:hypothetical protein